MSNKVFRFTTAGESHGRALVAIVEGLPAGLPIDVGGIDRELARRQWGYGRGGRMKIEQDQVEILSGVRHGLTLGSPIALMIENKDWANWTEVMAVGSVDIAPEKSRRLKRPLILLVGKSMTLAIYETCSNELRRERLRRALRVEHWRSSCWLRSASKFAVMLFSSVAFRTNHWNSRGTTWPRFLTTRRCVAPTRNYNSR